MPLNKKVSFLKNQLSNKNESFQGGDYLVGDLGSPLLFRKENNIDGVGSFHIQDLRPRFKSIQLIIPANKTGGLKKQVFQDDDQIGTLRLSKIMSSTGRN